MLLDATEARSNPVKRLQVTADDHYLGNGHHLNFNETQKTPDESALI